MVRALENIEAHNKKLQAEYDAAYESRRKELQEMLYKILSPYQIWFPLPNKLERHISPINLSSEITEAVLKLDESK
jgi:hypothetical protein